jgi:hypothetical protein
VRSFSDRGNKHAEILVNPTIIKTQDIYNNNKKKKKKKKKLGEIDNVGFGLGALG